MNEKYKSTVIKAAAYVVFGYGLSQVIRLSGNLVLARLLKPEYFGIIAISNVLMRGLYLFSDIGIEPAIIRHPRAEEKIFLNTAWSLQFIRGGILFGIALLIAYPISLIYKEHILAYIFPFIGLTAVFNGLQSTSIYVLSKNLRQDKITIFEIGIQTISMLTMIIIAYLFHSIWALVLGTVVSNFIKMIWSYFLIRGPFPKFHLEKEAMHEILSFGKWIFLSTAVMFLASQADRLMLGRIFPIAFFGVYSMASMFAELPKQIVNKLSSKVIFPLISKSIDIPRDELRAKISKQRIKILMALALVVAILTCFGDYLVKFLYDSRYYDAAWILPMLAIGIWPLVLHSTIGSSLLVTNHPEFSAYGNILKLIYMVVSIPLFYSVGGILGAIIAVVLNDIPVYIVTNIGLRKENLSFLKQDFIVTILLFILIGLLLVLRLIIGLNLPGVSEYSLG